MIHNSSTNLFWVSFTVRDCLRESDLVGLTLQWCVLACSIVPIRWAHSCLQWEKENFDREERLISSRPYV